MLPTVCLTAIASSKIPVTTPKPIPACFHSEFGKGFISQGTDSTQTDFPLDAFGGEPENFGLLVVDVTFTQTEFNITVVDSDSSGKDLSMGGSDVLPTAAIANGRFGDGVPHF